MSPGIHSWALLALTDNPCTTVVFWLKAYLVNDNERLNPIKYPIDSRKPTDD
jgi:hypothetical protein